MIPRVSVILPLYNGHRYIERAIQSLQAQTYLSWELIIISEFGNDDGGVEIVQKMAEIDARIRLLQNEIHLGLAESLNRGIRESKGEYIARLDADDTSLPERLAKQVAFMDENQDIGICGTWQLHYGKGYEWVHRAEPNPEKLRCRLLFWCDLCHSTVMLRKDVLLDHHLFYDPTALAEDFELWSRAICYTRIANIPEVLGTYNESSGITEGKKQQLNEESGQIAARTLQRTLGLKLNHEDIHLLNSWVNPLEHSLHRQSDLQRLKWLLIEIWKMNERIHFFDSKFLLQTLSAKWFWVKDYTDWKTDYSGVRSISEAFSKSGKPGFLVRYRGFRTKYPKLNTRIRKIAHRILHRR